MDKKKVGKDARSSPWKNRKTFESRTIESMEGLQFDRGYLSPYFVTDPRTHGSCELENTYILIPKRRSLTHKDILPLLEQVCEMASRSLSSPRTSTEKPSATLVVNKLRPATASGCRQGPWIRRSPQGHVADIATLTGGKAVTRRSGHPARARTSSSRTSVGPRRSPLTRTTRRSSKSPL